MTVHGMDNRLNVHAEDMQVLSEYDMIELMAGQKLSGVYPKTVTGKHFGGVQFHIPVKEEDPTRKSDGKRSPEKKKAAQAKRQMMRCKQHEMY